MGSLIFVVLSAYSYIESYVRNICKFKYFDDKNINDRMAIFDLNRWDCLLSVKGCGSGGFTRYDLLREELLVLNSRVTFCLLLFFCWN